MTWQTAKRKSSVKLLRADIIDPKTKKTVVKKTGEKISDKLAKEIAKIKDIEKVCGQAAGNR